MVVKFPIGRFNYLLMHLKGMQTLKNEWNEKQTTSFLLQFLIRHFLVSDKNSVHSFSECLAVSVSFLNRNHLRRIPYRAFYNVTHLDLLWVFLTVIP